MGKKISFVKSPEEIAALRAFGKGNDLDWFLNQERISFAWTIDEAVYRELLPPPLEPVSPVVVGWVAYFGRPDGGATPYKEAGLFILGRYGDTVGEYCLSMPLDRTDMCIFLGRDLFGYPKRLSNITLRRSATECTATVERGGITFFELRGKFGPANEPAAFAEALPPMEPGVPGIFPTLLLDYKIKCPGEEVCHRQNWTFTDVNLNRSMAEVITFTNEDASLDITLRESDDDPWAQLAPKKILGGRWSKYQTRLFGSTSLKKYTEAEIPALEPWLFNKYDGTVFGNPRGNF